MQVVIISGAARVQQVFGKFDGTPGSNNEIQMIICSEKLKEEIGG